MSLSHNSISAAWTWEGVVGLLTQDSNYWIESSFFYPTTFLLHGSYTTKLTPSQPRVSCNASRKARGVPRQTRPTCCVRPASGSNVSGPARVCFFDSTKVVQKRNVLNVLPKRVWVKLLNLSHQFHWSVVSPRVLVACRIHLVATRSLATSGHPGGTPGCGWQDEALRVAPRRG